MKLHALNGTSKLPYLGSSQHHLLQISFYLMGEATP